MTTTVLTLTITGLAADSRIAGGKGDRSGRRIVSIAAMGIGAAVGAVLLGRFGLAAALGTAGLAGGGVFGVFFFTYASSGCSPAGLSPPPPGCSACRRR